MTFQKLDPFPYSDEGGKTPTQLGPLERANLNHWTTPVRFTQLFKNRLKWFKCKSESKLSASPSLERILVDP
jgi:hypothetical protein